MKIRSMTLEQLDAALEHERKHGGGHSRRARHLIARRAWLEIGRPERWVRGNLAAQNVGRKARKQAARRKRRAAERMGGAL